MSLKDILSSKKDEPKEYFWAITIESGWIQAGIWRVLEDKTQVVVISPPTPWELEEEVVSAVDIALSSCIKNFPEDLQEPSKAVFGVIANWVSKGEIKEEYLEKIKKICSELTLKPVGFVVLSEAITHLIKSVEGTPVNAIILGVSKENIEVSVFRLGKLLGTFTVGRSISIVDDVVEGLNRFDQKEPYPSRLIIYDGKEGELEEIRQTLLKADWQDFEKINFLHTPKIEVIASEKKVHAVSLAGASELADVTSVYIEKDEEKVEEKKDIDEEVTGEVVTPAEPISPQELGFAIGKDIAEVVKRKEEAEIAPQVLKKEEVARQEIPEPTIKERDFETPTSFMKFKLFSIFGAIKNKLSKLSLDSMRFSAGAAIGRKTFIFGVLFFVAILIGAFAFWWFYPKAQLTIYVSPRKLDEKVRITVDTQLESADLTKKVLPGRYLTANVAGERTKSTTGSKTVGEKARGEVTLFRVGPELTIATGTKLMGPNNLGFTLDESVTVASGSASTPGTTKVGVTASDIGAQYNLASQTSFSVGNYSTADIEAKNEAAFSGGSSREISAVSEEDQKVLEKELKDELKDKAHEDLKKDLSEQDIFIEETLAATPSSRTFSNKVGDEATTLKLSLSLDTKAVAVNEGMFSELAQNILKEKVPEGFVLRSDQVDVDFNFEGEVNGRYDLSTAFSANLLPKIDIEEVTKKIVGRYPKVVEEYLKAEIPGFVRAEIIFRKPRFPGKLGTMPRVLKNIEVIISAER